jgi:hypothetical protein
MAGNRSDLDGSSSYEFLWTRSAESDTFSNGTDLLVDIAEEPSLSP